MTKSDVLVCIDEILKNAPVDVPLSEEVIQQEINAVRYSH